MIRIGAYLIAAICLIAVGWFAHDAHVAKEIARETQKAEDRYHALRKSQEAERQELEKERLADRAKAESRLRQALAENRQLRTEADAPVNPEFMVYARLCDSAEDCTVFYRPPVGPASAAPEGSIAITALEIYATLRTLDELILQHNLELAQIKTQLSACRQ